MDGKQEEIHNILVALLSGKEEEIYNVLYKKKEIDDKTPKLRTEDEKKKLKSLSNKMRKFHKDLIDDIKKNFRFYKEHLKQLNKEKNKTKSVIGKNILQNVFHYPLFVYSVSYLCLFPSLQNVFAYD